MKLYIIGVSILVVAIIANIIIAKIGLLSWYDFLNQLNEKGNSALKSIGVIDYVWLFIGYPLVLSLGYVIGNKVYSILF